MLMKTDEDTLADWEARMFGDEELALPREKIVRWALTHIPSTTSGRSEAAATDLLSSLLDKGWEPFAVSDGKIWLRLKSE